MLWYFVQLDSPSWTMYLFDPIYFGHSVMGILDFYLSWMFMTQFAIVKNCHISNFKSLFYLKLYSTRLTLCIIIFLAWNTFSLEGMFSTRNIINLKIKNQILYLLQEWALCLYSHFLIWSKCFSISVWEIYAN